MKYVNRLRMGAAILLYLLSMAFLIWPIGMLKRGAMARAWSSQAERRRANAAHNTVWGTRMAAMVRLVLGFRARIILSEEASRVAFDGRPHIYVANHRSVLDALILPLVAMRLGNADIRWVVNWGLLRVPLLGGVFSDAGYAVVRRRKDVPDMDPAIRRHLNAVEMETYVRRAREDGASVGLFPEGERFTAPAPGARRRHVGELVGKQSFRSLCAELPGHGVASVTVLWPPVAGKTVFDVSDLCDRTVDVCLEIRGHVRPEEADAFLEDEFEAKERALAGTSAAHRTA